jgi:hypothetical protein
MPQGTKIAEIADLARASEWSRRVYGALRDWEAARRGRWSTWASADVLLTIDTSPDGRACEPVSIAASHERIAFHTRNWETDLPREGQSFDAAITALRDLARQWFAGEVALAAFYLGDVWQGAIAIDPRRLEEEMQTALRWIASQTAVDRVELHGPRAAEDQRFGLSVDGQPLRRPN